jgi:hypothetical protein
LYPGRQTIRAITAAFFVVLSAGSGNARVLEERDLEGVAQIKSSFAEVVGDIVQTSRRTYISGAEGECIRSTLRELMQISDELASYEYLITIENEIKDFGYDSTIRGIIRFAVDKAVRILETQRRRLGQLPDQCSRLPVSAGKTQQAVRFIEATAATLRSLQPRL